MSDARADLILKSLEGRSDSLNEIVDLVREISKTREIPWSSLALKLKRLLMLSKHSLKTTCRSRALLLTRRHRSLRRTPQVGTGMSVFGPTTKRAEGRQSEATNILAQVIAQNSSIHIKARTNKALQSLYNLVGESNPNEDV